MTLLRQRFYENVKPGSGCWLWRGSLTAKGYGRIKIKRKHYGAHRLSWIVHNGDIPDGLCVCHKCDTPQCVNPSHLFLGSHADNQRDCQRKGRRASGAAHGHYKKPEAWPRGRRHFRAKLSDEKVRYIREMRGAVPQRVLAEKFNVPQTAISAVQRNKTWRHVI